MSSPSPLKPVRSSLHQETASYLRELADRADKGEIVTVTVVAECPEGYYEVTGSRLLSRLQTIGALAEAMHMRMHEE